MTRAAETSAVYLAEETRALGLPQGPPDTVTDGGTSLGGGLSQAGALTPALCSSSAEVS